MGLLVMLLLGILGWLGGSPAALAAPLSSQEVTVDWLQRPPAANSFTRALAPQELQFPQDFGSHDSYQTEWWYYTGNLTGNLADSLADNPTGNPGAKPIEQSQGSQSQGTQSQDDRAFGFQLTFFRRALSSPLDPWANPAHGASPWRTTQLYSAHFTLSDLDRQQFHAFERFSRGAVDLAGAKGNPYRIWLGDWAATREPNGVRLQAQGVDSAIAPGLTVGIDLQVTSPLPPILHGDRGLSQKSPEPGNASYYYSLVQQPTSGTLTLGDQTFAVTGVTWTDHEYSTSALGVGTVGWDWFSMQMEDGSALMLYNLRHEDGSSESTSSGTAISATGETTTLALGDWDLQVLDYWTSPKTQITYPARWRVTVPSQDLAIEVVPQMADQELVTATTTYWEGAIAVTGYQGDRSIAGQGYGELTGYGTRLDGLLGSQN